MACSHGQHAGQQYGNLFPRSVLKKSFNERLAASFRAENKLNKWKFGLLFANCIILAVSAGLAVLAYYLRRHWLQYAPFLDVYTGRPYLALQALACVLCACALLPAALLCLRTYPLLVAYVVILFVVMLFQLGLFAYSALRAEAAASSAVGDSFRGALKMYDADLHFKDSVDYVQESLLCCGADDFEDWFDTDTDALPHSCCWRRPSSGEHNCLNVDMLYVQTDSCLPKLQEIPSAGITIIYAVIGFLTISQAITLLVAWRVARLARAGWRARGQPWRPAHPTQPAYPTDVAHPTHTTLPAHTMHPTQHTRSHPWHPTNPTP